MRLTHEKIDYIAVSMLIFNAVMLVSIWMQSAFRHIIGTHYPDNIIAVSSIIVAIAATRRKAVSALLGLIHVFFRLDR